MVINFHGSYGASQCYQESRTLSPAGTVTAADLRVHVCSLPTARLNSLLACGCRWVQVDEGHRSIEEVKE